MDCYMSSMEGPAKTKITVFVFTFQTPAIVPTDATTLTLCWINLFMNHVSTL